MRVNLPRILIFLTVLSLSGCAANSYVSELKGADLPTVGLQYNVQEVEFIDSRKDQKTEDIELPFVSKPNMTVKHVPALTQSHKDLLEKVIKENTTYSGTSVKAVVDIADSYKEFKATWTSEREKSFADLKVSFIDKETGDPLAGCSTSGEFFVQSIDATKKRTEEIYQLTLKNVLYNCLKSIAGQGE